MAYTKSQLLSQLNDPGSPFITALRTQYSNQQVVSSKIARITNILASPELSLHEEVIITRCPGRISLSKHADYINNDLLYTLGDRDIYLAAQIIDEPKLILINSGQDFDDYEIGLENLDQVDKTSWAFYPAALYQALIKSGQGMVLVYNSDLPAAGGLSSSHALMLSTAIAMLGVSDQRLTPNTEHLINLCQQVENARGFSSGLGDQSAQLLCRKDHFAFIKLFPEPGAPANIEYRKLPDDLAIISAPSFIKADKSLPEFQVANTNIQAYKQINELSHQYGCEFLGDLLYKFTEEKIFMILESIEDKSLRGLALYGLAEAARVKALKEHLDLESLGRHLNLSHQAERNYYYNNETQNWEALSLEEKLNYKFNPNEALASHSGIYLASTIVNDQLQSFSNSLRGVYGSSISGAGLGGNNTIVCNKDSAEAVKAQLLDGFYRQRNLEAEAQDKVHISSSSAAASRVI